MVGLRSKVRSGDSVFSGFIGDIMSYIGICEYLIGVIHDKDIWYYIGTKDANGKRLRSDEQYSSFLVDAKRYDNEDILYEELESLPKTLTYKIFELQCCPKCKKEFTEHQALSREDNETEICRSVESGKRSKLIKNVNVFCVNTGTCP